MDPSLCQRNTIDTGPIVAIQSSEPYVRFTPKSGYCRGTVRCPLSANSRHHTYEGPLNSKTDSRPSRSCDSIIYKRSDSHDRDPCDAEIRPHGSRPNQQPPIREAAFASLKAPLRPVPVQVDPTDASEERQASGR